jgi:hypothetical protein
MSSQRQDTGSALQRPLTAHRAADADGCTTSSRGEQPVLPGAVDRVLRDISQASAAERVMPGALLDGYLAALWTVARTGSRLSGEQEASCRRLGGEAAATGLELLELVDLYMTASRRVRETLPVVAAYTPFGVALGAAWPRPASTPGWPGRRRPCPSEERRNSPPSNSSTREPPWAWSCSPRWWSTPAPAVQRLPLAPHPGLAGPLALVRRPPDGRPRLRPGHPAVPALGPGRGRGTGLGCYLGVVLTCFLAWQLLTGAGALLAGVLPAQLPLEMAAPLTFLLLLLPTHSGAVDPVSQRQYSSGVPHSADEGYSEVER